MKSRNSVSCWLPLQEYVIRPGPLHVKFSAAYPPQIKHWTNNSCPGAQVCNCLWSTSVDICGTDITHGTFLHGSGYFKRLSAAGVTSNRIWTKGMTVRSGNPQSWLISGCTLYNTFVCNLNKKIYFRNGFFINLHFSVLLKSIYCRLNLVQSCLSK
jgi:hypothetical protein